MPVTKLDLRIVERDIPAYILAAKAGMSPSRVSEYRRGHKKIPARHLVALAVVLRCNPEDIAGFAETTYLGK